jgi:hypothetical protein
LAGKYSELQNFIGSGALYRWVGAASAADLKQTVKQSWKAFQTLADADREHILKHWFKPAG